MECVLKSQLIRMFAFGHAAVRPTDVVLTADVDLFLMTENILAPIYDHPGPNPMLVKSLPYDL
jgi:hypothetical protein